MKKFFILLIILGVIYYIFINPHLNEFKNNFKKQVSSKAEILSGDNLDKFWSTLNEKISTLKKSIPEDQYKAFRNDLDKAIRDHMSDINQKDFDINAFIHRTVDPIYEKYKE